MGKLILSHWARLLILTAASYQTLASIYAFFWPKLFFDFLTTNLDGIVKPLPILQIINLLLGILGVCWEWPLPLFTHASEAVFNKAPKKRNAGGGAGKPGPEDTRGKGGGVSKVQKVLAGMHRSIEARLIVYPLSALAALLLYQATNAGLYYIIGMGVYFGAFSQGEIVMGTPWTLPKRGKGSGGRARV